MDSKSSDQSVDLPSSTREPPAEGVVAPEATAEDAGTGSQAPGAKSKEWVSKQSLYSIAHMIISQDYIGVLVAMVVLVLVIGVMHPDFLAPGQLLDILNQATFVAVLACGMAFLLAMRELDLSVGSTYGLTCLCAALLIHSGMSSWLGALIGIVIGAVLGLVNGFLIQLFRLPSIVATLATMSIYRGLTFALSNGTQVIGPSLSDPFARLIGGHLFGIPTNVWVMIVVVVI